MEKMFTLTPDHENGKLIANVDGKDAELVTSLIITSWDKNNPDWFWRINREDVKSDPRIRNAKFLVSTELYRNGILEYAGRDVAIAKHGTGIILGSGKPYVRAVDKSVIDFMRDREISTLMKEPPATDRIRLKDATIQFRVFTIDGEEKLPVGGSFMLDREQPWIVEHRRVVKSNVSVWKALCIPNGFKFNRPAEKPVEEKSNVPGIEHKEEAVMAPNSSEETFTTIGAATGNVLDQIVAESAKEISVEIEAAPETNDLSIEEAQAQFGKEMMAEEPLMEKEQTLAEEQAEFAKQQVAAEEVPVESAGAALLSTAAPTA